MLSVNFQNGLQPWEVASIKEMAQLMWAVAIHLFKIAMCIHQRQLESNLWIFYFWKEVTVLHLKWIWVLMDLWPKYDNFVDRCLALLLRELPVFWYIRRHFNFFWTLEKKCPLLNICSNPRLKGMIKKKKKKSKELDELGHFVVVVVVAVACLFIFLDCFTPKASPF